MSGTPPFRTDLYSTCGTLVSHQEYIALVNSWGLVFTPEAKEATGVVLPWEGYSREKFLRDIVGDYKKAGISANRVWPQSFFVDDVYYWLATFPEFGKQAIYLDGRVDTPEGYGNATASLGELARIGVRIVGPAMFALTKVGGGMGGVLLLVSMLLALTAASWRWKGRLLYQSEKAPYHKCIFKLWTYPVHPRSRIFVPFLIAGTRFYDTFNEIYLTPSLV